MVAAVIFSILFLSTIVGAGYVLWTAGKYTVSKVQQWVPDNVPANIDSALTKIDQNQIWQNCTKTLMGFLAVEPWLSQPLADIFNKISLACWNLNPEQNQTGEQT